MKTNKFKSILFFSLFASSAFGQITLDYEDTNSEYNLGTTFYAVDIDDDETKYFFFDEVNNQFDLYNMDFTPFMSNIQLPGAYDTDYSVIYISRKLFDCDDSNIEFIYSATNDPSGTFQILRTDGTVLFSQDSTYGIYCLGCLGGSQDIRPIRKTSAGTKLFLGKFASTNSSMQTQVYSICGDLPAGYSEMINPQLIAAKVFPNPTTGEVVFDVNLPSNIQNYDLIIYDVNGNQILKEQDIKTTKHTINTTAFSSGTYFYALTNKNKSFATGKLVTRK